MVNNFSPVKMELAPARKAKACASLGMVKRPALNLTLAFGNKIRAIAIIRIQIKGSINVWFSNGVPLTGTSANRSGSPPLSTAKEVSEQFGREIDLILDSGHSPGGLPSTILNLSEVPKILREGSIAVEEIQAVLAQQGLSLD